MKTARIEVRTTDELKAWVEKRRETTGVPTNIFINRLIEAARKQEGPKPRPKRVAASA